MKKVFCDVEGCHEEAVREDVDVCISWVTSQTINDKTWTFKPFEHPDVSKRDLCAKHFKLWCKATYEAVCK